MDCCVLRIDWLITLVMYSVYQEAKQKRSEMSAAKRPRTDEPYETSRIVHVGQLPAREPLKYIKDVLCREPEVQAALHSDPKSMYFSATYGHVDIEYFSAKEAQSAFEKLTDRVVEGRTLTVELGPSLPTTALFREIVDEEPTEDYFFVIVKTTGGKQEAFLVYRDELGDEDSIEEFVRRNVLGASKDCYFVGELDARLRACIAQFKWKDLIFVDATE